MIQNERMTTFLLKYAIRYFCLRCYYQDYIAAIKTRRYRILGKSVFKLCQGLSFGVPLWKFGLF